MVGYRYFDNPLFNQVLEYIDQNYKEEMKLCSCASELCMSESNISRLFKKYTNTSFTSYYNAVRIKHAEQYLLEGYSIKEAAEMSGYNNLNYFYKNFKIQHDMTPKEYLDHMKTQPGP